MIKPPLGLCLTCYFARVRDGDTIGINFPLSTRHWYIRLIDCWAPDAGEPGYEEATKYCLDLCKSAKWLTVWFPEPASPDNILKFLSFDRIPGHLWLDYNDKMTLSEMMVAAGLATKHRPKPKNEHSS